MKIYLKLFMFITLISILALSSPYAADIQVLSGKSRPNPFTPNGNGISETTTITMEMEITITVDDLLNNKIPEIMWHLQIRDQATNEVVKNVLDTEVQEQTGTYARTISYEWDGTDNDGFPVPFTDYFIDFDAKLRFLLGGVVIDEYEDLENRVIQVRDYDIVEPATYSVTVAEVGLIQPSIESEYPYHKLLVPPGAVPNDTNITVSPPVDNFGFYQMVDFDYPEKEFLFPVNLTLEFKVQDVPEGYSPTDMVVCTWNEEYGKWDPVAAKTENTHDITDLYMTVTAPVDHLSLFGAAVVDAPGPPSRLKASSGDGFVALEWWTRSEPDMDYYNIYRTSADSSSASLGIFYQNGDEPADILMDSWGQYIVLMKNSGDIYNFQYGGTPSIVYDNNSNLDEEFKLNNPSGFILLDDDTALVVEEGSGEISEVKINGSNNITRKVPGVLSSLDSPKDIVKTHIDGSIYYAISRNPSGVGGEVVLIDEIFTTIDTIATGLNSASGLELYKETYPYSSIREGEIYVADTANNEVLKIYQDASQMWTTSDYIDDTMGLSSPMGLHFDARGNLFISESSRVRYFDQSDDSLTTVLDNTITTPGSMTLGWDGVLYIVDSGDINSSTDDIIYSYQTEMWSNVAYDVVLHDGNEFYTGYNDTWVTNGEEYLYRVTAVNTIPLESTSSNEVKGMPSGQFVAGTPLTETQANVFFMSRDNFADLNGDDNIDFVANYSNGLIVYLHTGNTSEPFFATEVYLPTNNLSNRNDQEVILRDFDNDGDADILTSDIDQYGEGRIYIIENEFIDGAVTGPLAFDTTPHIVASNLNAFTLAAEDMDRDGDVDIIIGTQAGTDLNDYIYSNDGNWNFHLAYTFPDPSPTTAIEIADLNRDGYLDIFLGKATIASPDNISAVNQVYINDAELIDNDGITEFSFTAEPQDWTVGNWGDFPTILLTSVDVNNDGFLDIVEGLATGELPEQHYIGQNDLIVHINDPVTPGHFLGCNLCTLDNCNDAPDSYCMEVDEPALIDVGDIDNDHDYDLIIGAAIVTLEPIPDPPPGTVGFQFVRKPVSKVFRNTGGRFVDYSEDVAGSQENGGSVLIDVDDDGDLDALSNTTYDLTANSFIHINKNIEADPDYRNNPNLAPALNPDILFKLASSTPEEIGIEWVTAAYNEKLPFTHLSYDLRIGATSSSDGDVFISGLPVKSSQRGSVTRLDNTWTQQWSIKRELMHKLIPGNNYKMSIRTTDPGYASSDWLADREFYLLPSTTLSLTGWSTDYISLSWSAVTGANIGYNVYYKNFSDGYFIKQNSSPVTGTTYDLPATGSSFEYWVAVTAVDLDYVAGNMESPYSNTVQLTTWDLVPAVNEITVSWGAIDGAESYKIYKDGAFVCVQVGNAPYSATGSEGSKYRLTVAAFESGIETVSISGEIITLFDKLIVTAQDVGKDYVTLNWNIPSVGKTNLLKYRIYMRNSSFAGSVAGEAFTVESGSETYTFSGLNPDPDDTPYYFAVTAVNKNTDAAKNENTDVEELAGIVLNTTDENPPAQVSNLQAIRGDSSVRLTWDLNSEPDVAKYEIYRGGVYFNDISGFLEPYYTIESNALNTYLDAGVTNGTTYWYAVVAVDTSENKMESVTSVSATPTDLTAPSPVTNFYISSVGDSQLTLKWDANSDPDFSSYHIYRDDDESITAINPPEPVYSTTSVEWTNTSLTNETMYYYAISVEDTSGNFSRIATTTGTPRGNVPAITDPSSSITVLQNTYIVKGTGPFGYDINLKIGGTTVETFGPVEENGLWSQSVTFNVVGENVLTATSVLGADESVPSVARVVTYDPPPAKPTITDIDPGDTTLTLYWTAPADTDIQGFNIYRNSSSNPVNYQLIPYIPDNLEYEYDFTDGGLSNGRLYSYVVKAVDQNNSSGAGSDPESASPVATADWDN